MFSCKSVPSYIHLPSASSTLTSVSPVSVLGTDHDSLSDSNNNNNNSGLTYVQQSGEINSTRRNHLSNIKLEEYPDVISIDPPVYVENVHIPPINPDYQENDITGKTNQWINDYVRGVIDYETASTLIMTSNLYHYQLEKLSDLITRLNYECNYDMNNLHTTMVDFNQAYNDLRITQIRFQRANDEHQYQQQQFSLINFD
ncbi:unnamed protein product [Cunninghamella blakesleeana]